MLREAEKLTSLFTDQDPILERSIKFKRGVDELVMAYKETLRLLEASACQKPITSFFQPSQARTSPGFDEEPESDPDGPAAVC